MNDRIFGIDLGTTNSCLATMDPAGPRTIAIDGDPIVPSVVSFDRDRGELVVGQRARNRLLLAPESTVRSIKRRMGRQETTRLGDREMLPEEIAAEILRYLKTEGEKAEGCEIRRAVITVPAYFEDAQRRATIRAGELAGLEVVRILNEPTAAALVYNRLELRGGEAAAPAATSRRSAGGGTERVLVYDLGGGTFDVSVVEIRGELHEVRASCGDNHLGGDDFDELIVEHLLQELRREHGRDLSPDARAMARLRYAAEGAKIELSSQPFSRVMEEALAPGVHLDVELARTTFEELVRERLESTLTEVDRALEEARLSAGQIDRVVLMGGSTRIPRVLEMLSRHFDGPVEHSLDPALCVALGAAVQGAVLNGEVFDQILVDVAPHSLGIQSLAVSAGFGPPVYEPDHFSTIIRRNTQIPVTRSELYHTVVDNQEDFNVEVYQGERALCSDNTLIGEFSFEFEPAPEGSPVVVELGYDLDGIVRVRVAQKGTGNRKEVTLDTRHRRLDPANDEALDSAAAVDNYILRKARKLSGELPAGGLRQRLLETAGAYEAVLGAQAVDPAQVDRLEDDLLELLEEAEEVHPAGEP